MITNVCFLVLKNKILRNLWLLLSVKLLKPEKKERIKETMKEISQTGIYVSTKRNDTP